MALPIRPLWTIPLGLVAGGVLALAVAGCGGSARTDGTVVRVNERDFAISASPAHVRAGTVVFRIDNHGPDAHELIVIRLRGKSLPLRSDGMTIDEEALTKQTVGGLEPGPPGDVRYLNLHLSPGRYELVCNMSGHFMGGMHTVVVASR